MALDSYRADSYLVLAGGSLGGGSQRMGQFPLPAPHCPQEISLSPAGGNLCLPGKLREAGKEKINSGCLGFLARPE